MQLNFRQIYELTTVFNELKDTKMPFRLSLIIAKNMDWLEREFNFFKRAEQDFAVKYLQFDENGQPIKSDNGGYKIKDGMYEECMAARQDLDMFTVDVRATLIPAELLESMSLSPRQVKILSILLKEGE